VDFWKKGVVLKGRRRERPMLELKLKYCRSIDIIIIESMKDSIF
jgi:hypothetical protein